MLMADTVVVIQDTQLDPGLHGDICVVPSLLCILEHRAIKKNGSLMKKKINTSSTSNIQDMTCYVFKINF